MFFRQALASSQVSAAEAARFELARGCPQHAFQVCALAFAPGRGRPRPGHCAARGLGGRPRTRAN